MLYCPKCNKTFKIIQYSQNDETESSINGRFCPQCGWHPGENEVTYEIQEINLFDKITTYTNCTVEVLENSITREVSIGWYKTDETEEISFE